MWENFNEMTLRFKRARNSISRNISQKLNWRQSKHFKMWKMMRPFFFPHCVYLLWLFFFAQTIIKLCYVGEGFLCNSPFSIKYPGGLSIFVWWDLSWKLKMKSRKLDKNSCDEIKANGPNFVHFRIDWIFEEMMKIERKKSKKKKWKSEKEKREKNENPRKKIVKKWKYPI